jgi:multiple sugar transport system permease protein
MFNYILIIIAILISILPLYWLLITSFKKVVDIYQGNPLLPTATPIFKNYTELFSTKETIRAILNSFIVTISVTSISLFLGILAAYSIYKYKFKGSTAFIVGVLILRVLPPVVMIIPFFLLFKYIRLLDNVLALIISYPILTLPLVIWMLTGFLSEIPKSIEESARVDGASFFGVLFKIIIPLIAPGIAATAVFSIIGCWNEYIIASIITSTVKSQTVPIILSLQQTMWGTYWGKICALSIFMIIPMVIFAFFVQKYMASGLTAGAVKE